MECFAGINVAMPNLVLNPTKRELYASYVAFWFAWTQLVYALSTVGGACCSIGPANKLRTLRFLAKSAILQRFSYQASCCSVTAGLATRVAKLLNQGTLDYHGRCGKSRKRPSARFRWESYNEALPFLADSIRSLE